MNDAPLRPQDDDDDEGERRRPSPSPFVPLFPFPFPFPPKTSVPSTTASRGPSPPPGEHEANVKRWKRVSSERKEDEDGEIDFSKRMNVEEGGGGRTAGGVGDYEEGWVEHETEAVRMDHEELSVEEEKEQGYRRSPKGKGRYDTSQHSQDAVNLSSISVGMGKFVGTLYFVLIGRLHSHQLTRYSSLLERRYSLSS